MKTCTKCGAEKSLDEFYARRPECKDCTRAQQRSYRQNLTPTIPDRKVCPRCGKQKPEGEFHRNASRPDGLLAYCKPCWASLERVRRYGITDEEFAQRWEDQGGKCKICPTIFMLAGDAHVDHDHVTGDVRGLLCSSCNTGLGQFKDSAIILRRAAEYLDAC